VPGDFDQEGDVDLYVANDSVGNYFFERREDRFVETGLELGVSMSESGRPQAGMGVESGDIDNDGRLDLFVTNFSHDVNTLYHNEVVGNGMMLFSDDTYILDLGQASFDKLSWGTLIEDLDRDGWPDIVVVSGHVYPQVDGAGLGTSYRQPNQVFRNLGPDSGGRLRFVVASGPADLNAAGPKVSRGLVSADLDNDGDIDLLVVEMDTRPTLLRNDTRNPGAWIGFRLQGAGGNRDAIGARLEVTDATGATRVRERASGRSYLSSPDPRLVVGLGRASGPVQRVRVRWPSGATLEASVLETGRYYLLDEATGQATPMP
jgi:hypothetical protein